MSSAIPARRRTRSPTRWPRLQLTNILRDLAEDAERGRLYLPRELLDRHGIRSDDPAAVLRHPALPAVCRDLAALAIQHFDAASAAMTRASRRAMRPAAVMGAFYRAMLDALVEAGWRDPPPGSASRKAANYGWCCATG